MYSKAVSSIAPERLLMISGQAERHLRDAALNAMEMVGAGGEGDTVLKGSLARRAVVAPGCRTRWRPLLENSKARGASVDKCGI
jgi:hypothetical protein